MMCKYNDKDIPIMNNSEQVRNLLEIYFDAFYHVNLDALSVILHEAVHVYGHDEDGMLRDTTKETFLDILGGFKSHNENPNFVRNDEILSIDFASEDIAVARVRLSFDDSICTDILSLIRLNNEWRVISILDSRMSVS